MAKLLLQYVFQNKISYSYSFDQSISMKCIYHNIMGLEALDEKCLWTRSRESPFLALLAALYLACFKTDYISVQL